MVYAWGDTVRRIEATFGFGEWDAMMPTDPNDDLTAAYVFARESITNIASLRPVNGTGFLAARAGY